MYSKQLLIKMDDDMLIGLKGMAEEFGVKISTFARMVLKNYLVKKQVLTKEDKEDIKTFQKYENNEGENFDDFVKEIFNEYAHRDLKKSKEANR